VADQILRSSNSSLLEPKLCAESDRTVSKVVQIPTKVSAVQTINRNAVIILIESIQEVGAQDELVRLGNADSLRCERASPPRCRRFRSLSIQLNPPDFVTASTSLAIRLRECDDRSV
jgi:hypothetical protein